MRLNTFLAAVLTLSFLTGTFPNRAQASQAPHCEEIFTTERQAKNDERPSQNVVKYEPYYSVRRGVEAYGEMLGPKFKKSLERLLATKGNHWFDSGAGEAFAVRQTLQQPEAQHLKATVVAYETSAKESENLKVLTGRFLESIPDAELPKSDLITDVVGPMAYTGQPHVVMQKYLDNLKPGGEIFISLGGKFELFGKANLVITASGEVLPLGEWLTRIPGTKAELTKEQWDDDGTIHEMWSVRLTKEDSGPRVPAVEMVYFKEGAPPTMIFKEVANKGVSSLNSVQEQARAVFKKRAEHMTASEFLDAFRGGEVSHPLIVSLKRLKKGDLWVNTSEVGAQVFAGLQKKDYQFKDTSIFTGLAQKFIRWRARGINTNKMVYTPLSDTKALPGLKEVRLITDLHGDFTSSYAPDVVLERYIHAMADNGEIYLYMGKEYGGFGSESTVLTKDGKRIPLRYWVKRIPGLSVGLFRGGYHWHGGEWAFLKVQISQRHKIEIPRLRLLGTTLDKDGVPMAYFEEL